MADIMTYSDETLLACQNSGFDPDDHFANVGKMVSKRSVLRSKGVEFDPFRIETKKTPCS